MSRPLARHVIPNHVVAVGENVVAAGRHGLHTVNGIAPTTAAAVFFLSQSTNSLDVNAMVKRRIFSIYGKAQRAQSVVDRGAFVKGKGTTRRDRIAHGARSDQTVTVT